MGRSPWQVPDHEKDDAHEPGDLTRRHTHGPRGNAGTHREGEIRPSRWMRLIVFVAGLAMLLFGLSLAFPVEGLSSDPYLVRALIILFIFGGAAAFWSRASLLKLVKMAGAWILILAAIVIFYLYRSDLGERFMSAVDPSGVMETKDGLLMVHRAADGHFWLRADMNGVPVRFMVDTGATNIVLSPSDARRIGLDPAKLQFNAVAGTANGDVAFARASVAVMRIGNTRYTNVPVTVNGSEMPGSLFGMTALNRFTSVEFRSNLLLLRP